MIAHPVAHRTGRRATAYALVVAVVLALAGCGSQRPATITAEPATGPGAPTVTTTAGTEMRGIAAPPPFVLRYDDHELTLHPYTFCYASGCADGMPQDPPDVGSPEEIEVFVPVEDWDLSATFTTGGDCGRSQTVEPERRGDGWFVLRPAGRAGDYAVDLFASGGGDMIARVLWSTPTDGPLAEPRATMSVIADHDGEPDSYGIELSLSNLAATPEAVTADVTVTAANGRSTTFAAHLADDDCRAPGSLFFDGPDAAGREAADLGGFPFRYDVRVVLDGVEHHATANYPRDVVKDEEPAVTLEFEPPLPALG